MERDAVTCRIRIRRGLRKAVDTVRHGLRAWKYGTAERCVFIQYDRFGKECTGKRTIANGGNTGRDSHGGEQRIAKRFTTDGVQSAVRGERDGAQVEAIEKSHIADGSNTGGDGNGGQRCTGKRSVSDCFQSAVRSERDGAQTTASIKSTFTYGSNAGWDGHGSQRCIAKRVVSDCLQAAVCGKCDGSQK